MNSYRPINQCRICGNENLDQVLDLGHQVLTGVFPKHREQVITKGQIQLVKCRVAHDTCGLLQMAHSYDLGEMYSDNYGYRSGLNASMVAHLHAKIKRILGLVELSGESLVLDIGSNDGTSLSFYPAEKCRRVGIDPTARKFREFYANDIHVIPDFFTRSLFEAKFPNQKAHVITSFSMFYDLEHPLLFAQDIAAILDNDGVWVFEQSYMPLMLERNSFDTACHEHLEYYAYKQIKWILDRCGLRAIDVEFNDVNGGSFSVTAAHQASKYEAFVGEKTLLENELALDEMSTYVEFANRVNAICTNLKKFVKEANRRGKRVAGLGASTKGNVLLQYCGFTQEEIFAIGEVNPDKFGRYTPGSLIPIKPDLEVIGEADYLIVLPWHFKEFFLQKYALYKGKLIFPLPTFEAPVY